MVDCFNTDGTATGFSSSFDTADDGILEINYGTQFIDRMTNVDRTRDCTVDIIGTRSSTGQLSSGFVAGGSISATRENRVDDVRLVIDN